MAVFKHKEFFVSADGVSAVKQLNANEVEVRYSDGKPALILRDTTSSEVLSAIDRAKGDADSA